MDKNDIIEYVMNTPHNTNRAVLSGMLNQLTEGGGGSSDFSVANVTVINNSSKPATASKNCPVIFEANELGEGSPAMVYYNLPDFVAAGETVVLRVPLYKGTCVWTGNPFSELVTHSVSGNIDISMGMYFITGDCTITIS